MNEQGCIVRRQSPDWGALGDEYFQQAREFEQLVSLPEGFMRQLVECWNRCFSVAYFDVRQQLKEIAERNLLRVHDTVMCELDDFHPGDFAGRYLLFIDDDDWYAPDLVARLKVHDAAPTQAIVWQSVRLYGPAEIRPDRYCFTNNYAITAEFFAGEGKELAAVAQHFKAEEQVTRPGFPVTYCEEALSVANKHPCSPSIMLNLYGEINDDILRRHVDNYVAELRRLEPEPRLRWIEPSLAELADLFEDCLG